MSEPVQQLLLLFIGKRYVLRDQLMVSDVDDQLILGKNFDPANDNKQNSSSTAVENDTKTYRKALFNDAFRRRALFLSSAKQALNNTQATCQSATKMPAPPRTPCTPWVKHLYPPISALETLNQHQTQAAHSRHPARQNGMLHQHPPASTLHQHQVQHSSANCWNITLPCSN